MNKDLGLVRHVFTEEDRLKASEARKGNVDRTNRELSKLQPLFITKLPEDFKEWCKENKKSNTYYYKYVKLLNFAKQITPTQKKTNLNESYLEEKLDFLISLVQKQAKQIEYLTEKLNGKFVEDKVDTNEDVEIDTGYVPKKMDPKKKAALLQRLAEGMNDPCNRAVIKEHEAIRKKLGKD